MNNITLQVKSRPGSRGIALVTALLLLSLFTVMTLSMVIATTSDTLIDGYYRNSRASFYGADSGVNAVRQALINDVLNNDVPTGYVPTTGAPALRLPNTSFPTDITSNFGSYNSILPSGSNSWPGTFKLDTTNSSISMTQPVGNSALCNPGSAVAITTAITCVYNYNYHLVVDGQSRSGEVNVVEEYGLVPLSVVMSPVAAPPAPFSNWSTLFNTYALCSNPLVPGTFSGKMFSNDSFNFGVFSTKYIFNGPVGAHDADVGYIFSDGTCNQSTTTSSTHSGTTINPTFTGGLTVGAAAVPLPVDTYSQMLAVINGQGGNCPAGSSTCTNTPPTNAQMAAVLTNAAGTAWSTSATSGVYLPYNHATDTLTTNGTTGAFGGLYVQGNVDQMTLTASTSGSGASTHKLQVISIKQSSTTTTVTLDLTAGTTTIADNHGNTSGAMAGLPENVNTSPQSEGMMVYVTGNISSSPTSTAPTGLSGPSSGAAIQDGSAVTITAGGTISVTGSITYSTEPVSLNVSDTAVTPAPTNVLGVYTTGGNVQFQPPSSVTTMEVDGSFATINGTAGSAWGLQASWNSIGTLNIVGGRVQNQALDGSSLGQRNIYFDQRFSNGFAPPWFPTTTLPVPPTDTASISPVTVKRLSWVNSSAQ
jgi:Tfp pilus assembly protein PilX